jgi:hypothetical protein
MSGPGEGVPSPTPDLPLSEQHLRMLHEGSGIDLEVVEARGYRTVKKKVELEKLGFGRLQRNVPALLIPVFSPAGEVVLHQSRPDEPRIKDGKAVKYETPSGSRMTIDVHPSMREKLGDPSVPLWITEGIKKGDSLTSRGLCTVTLLGVWNWRGTNEHGGKTALPEWEAIALNERRVYIVYDSDAELKPQVHEALSRLKSFLESRSAEVHVVYLPHGEGGKKQGVDDFFVAGHGVDDLDSHATTELREQHVGEEDPPQVYLATPQGIVWNKPTRHGTSPTPLTNFVAEITSDVVEDDGAEENHTFEIEACSGGRVRRFEVPAASFASMGWVARHLGASSYVYPGFGYKDHAAVAIQSLSGEITERRYFAHTGWRKIEGEWAYLHAGGAIGPKGPLSGVEVAMGDGRLGDCLLPEPPEGEALVEAVRASIRFLDLAPPEVAYPLLAAVYRAALGEASPVDLSVHLVGPTGAYKTEITALTQAYYGAAFNGRNLPGNWESTDNSLEKQAFLLKDAVLVVDDFAPTGTAGDVARMHRRADRLLRAQGNRSGRGRMWTDGTLRPQYHPRGLVVSSGEDTPRGQSLRARMLISEISPGDIDLNVLTEMQRAAAEGLLASAMSGYVRYLAPRTSGLKESLPVRQKALLEAVREDGRIHAGWRQIGTETGRMSCSKPALQQLPPEVKRYVRAPEGRMLVKADYSQIELRVAAKISGEERMLEAYQNGEDLHLRTAESLAHAGVGTVDRKLAKAVNFGLLYGQGAKGLKDYARREYEINITLEEAALYKKRFFETYPGLAAWHERERQRMKHGETQTRTLTGRRRTKVTNFTEWVNAPVQGTGADGLKLALALLWERRAECPGAVPVACVHDEIVIECNEDKDKKVKAWLEKTMIDGMDEVLNGPGVGGPRVPVEVETQITKTWAR